MTDTIRIYVDTAGEFRWTRRAPNGEIVADGSEGYTNREDAVDAANREAAPEPSKIEDDE